MTPRRGTPAADRRAKRWTERYPDSGFAFLLRCDICGDESAGRGATLHGARNALGYHSRHRHGATIGADGHKRLALTNDALDAIGEYLALKGVSLR